MKIPFGTLLTAMLCSLGSFATPEPPKTRSRDEGPGAIWTKPQIKSDSVPDKSTVKSQRIAKAKRKAKRGY